MISIELIRNNTSFVKKKLAKKGDKSSIDNLLELDKEYRSLITNLNELRFERNTVSKKIAHLKKDRQSAETEIDQMIEVGKSISNIEKESNKIKELIDSLLLNIPNLPHDSSPNGVGSKDNKLVREFGELKKTDYKIKNHIELGVDLNLFDFDRAAKISGSGFPLYTNKGAKLERALINYMLDLHTSEFGYVEIFPPFLVNSKSPRTTGNLPKFSDDMYQIENDNLWLIPTAEVPITNLHKDEILSEKNLPINYVSYSACFRREAGSHGKDTRGFLRLHQFNKVELVKFVKPDNSYEQLEALTLNAEAVLKNLGLKYRVIELCTGDLSFSAAKCYDIEVWSPAEEKWLEVSSCSNFESFQARRGNIKYRKNDGKTDFLHTLNGSGVATPRLLVALLESHQNKNGSINIPEPLQPYFGSNIID
ncbi:MAG: serine--tRNA ligase [bacterium TMED144]|nr:MAG: serine--tRNA ligase [bacterium TMED144]|tara:strand:+ start:2913 stop:4178 length:1266 start_codon:yes stop_codon:yes gene_type:complete